METLINVARLIEWPADQAVHDPLPIIEQRALVVALERLLSEARDVVARAGAALDAAILERDRAVWALEQLGELTGEARDGEE
jgi:hypothetical protein